MVIRILTGKEVAGAVRYNERKVQEGQAERIYIANYPDQTMAEKYAQFRLQLLEQLTRLNPTVAKPSLHLAIAFHPTESISNDQLCRIGSEVMTKAGYGRQPYLMYRHDDTHHPHIHIVSVSIDPDGRKISDSYMWNRLNKIRKDIEQKHGLVRAEQGPHQGQLENAVEGEYAQQDMHHQTVGNVIQQALDTFTFGSVESFHQYLRLQHVVMKETAGRSKTGVTFQCMDEQGRLTRPVTASRLAGKPTKNRLTDLFATQAKRHTTGCETMATVIRQRLSRYKWLTETEYKTTLQQIGIQVSERGGVYLYVQERAGLVARENEMGTAFCRQTLLPNFAENTLRKPIQEEETISPQKVYPIAGHAIHSPPGASSGLNIPLAVQKQSQQRLPQEQPESTKQQEPAMATKADKIVETTASPLNEGRGEGERRMSLIEKPRKPKKIFVVEDRAFNQLIYYLYGLLCTKTQTLL